MYFSARAWRSDNRDYYHCSVMVWDTRETPYQSSDALEITWQTDDRKENHEWYAGKIEITAGSGDKLIAKLAVAKKITPHLFYDGHWETVQPHEFIARLVAKFKAVQIVHDDRISEYVRLDQLQDPSLINFIDNYEVLRNPHCHYSALACGPEEAKKKIMQQAAKRMDAEFIKQFIEKDMPVMALNRRLPDNRHWLDVLNLWPEKELA